MGRISPDYVILGLLAGGTGHGYGLLEHFHESAPLGQIWSLSTSQLYSILKRLENRCEIDGREFFPDNAPPRTEYWLTPLGQHRLALWLLDPFPSASTRHIRTEFLSRLFVARRLKEPVEPIIASQRAAVVSRRQQLTGQRAAAHGVLYLSLDLLVNEMDIILDWLERCETHLAANPDDFSVTPFKQPTDRHTS